MNTYDLYNRILDEVCTAVREDATLGTMVSSDVIDIILAGWKSNMEKRGIMNREQNKGFYAAFREKIDIISNYSNKQTDKRVKEEAVEEKKAGRGENRFFSAFNSVSVDRTMDRKGKDSSTSRHAMADRVEFEESRPQPFVLPTLSKYPCSIMPSSSSPHDVIVKKEPQVDLGVSVQHKILFDIKFDEEDEDMSACGEKLEEEREETGEYEYLNKREEDVYLDDFDDDALFSDQKGGYGRDKGGGAEGGPGEKPLTEMEVKIEEAIRMENEIHKVQVKREEKKGGEEAHGMDEDMEEGEELNSDDDVSDYNEEFDTGDNLLLGYYVKSKRKKDKRKIIFRTCVLRINGQEQVVQDARGEFKWAASVRDK